MIILNVSKGIFYVYTFTYMLSATGVLNSWEELCIYIYVAGGNSPLEYSTNKIE